MTYDGVIRKALQQRYKKAFKYKLKERPTMVVIDLMQWVKVLPDDIYNVEQAVVHLVGRCTKYLAAASVLVVCWDKSSPVVKKIMCHARGKRYSRVKVIDPECAPILPADPREPLKARELHGADWLKFAANAHNLRRELGPRLVNAFMDPAVLRPEVGKMVLLDGFPLAFRKMHVFENGAARFGDPQYGVYEIHEMPTRWNIDESGDGFGQIPLTEADEAAHPDLYNRVLGIYGVEPSEQCKQGVWYEERQEMRNAIAEADNSIFFYDHFFPTHNQLLVINDGDAISIGLLYARERLRGDRFRNTQTLALKSASEEDRKHGPYVYVNLNRLYVLMEEDKDFLAAGVNNCVLPFVFLSILAGNDFFGNFCHGIGLGTIKKTYMDMLPFFANLLQWNSAGMTPDTRVERRVVVDEELFVQLAHHVFMTKFGPAMRKKHKSASWRLLNRHLQGKKTQLPSRAEIKRQCRQLTWNLDYWCNALRDVHVDPYALYCGKSYYGYEKNPESGEPQLSRQLCHRQRPVDEMYKRNFYKRKQKLKRATPTIPSPTRKRAIDEVAGELDSLFE